jgi:hypothetical protein
MTGQRKRERERELYPTPWYRVALITDKDK